MDHPRVRVYLDMSGTIQSVTHVVLHPNLFRNAPLFVIMGYSRLIARRVPLPTQVPKLAYGMVCCRIGNYFYREFCCYCFFHSKIIQ